MDGFIENLGIPFYDCVVMKDGKCVYRHSNGCTDTDKKTPVTGKELYDIYSCSKLITCTGHCSCMKRESSVLTIIFISICRNLKT